MTCAFCVCQALSNQRLIQWCYQCKSKDPLLLHLSPWALILTSLRGSVTSVKNKVALEGLQWCLVVWFLSILHRTWSVSASQRWRSAEQHNFLPACSPQHILCDIPWYSLRIVFLLVRSLFHQNRHLWPNTMGSIVCPWKESMCFANAALAAANLQDNLYIQPLIKERSYAWMTSSKVPGGCGKGPASGCGLSQGGWVMGGGLQPLLPQWMDHRDWAESSWGGGGSTVHHMTNTVRKIMQTVWVLCVLVWFYTKNLMKLFYEFLVCLRVFMSLKLYWIWLAGPIYQSLHMCKEVVIREKHNFDWRGT